MNFVATVTKEVTTQWEWEEGIVELECIEKRVTFKGLSDNGTEQQ